MKKIEFKALFKNKTVADSSDIKASLIWTPRRILLALAIVMSAALMFGQAKVAERFTEFSLQSFRDNATDMLTFLVNDRIRLQYADKIVPQVRDWSRFAPLVKAVKNNNAQNIEIQATAFHNDAVITRQEFDLVTTNIFDKDLNLLGTSTKGKGQTVLGITEFKKQLASRDKKATRIPVTFYWRTKEGRAVHSVIAPIGGFRVAGYIETVTNPFPHLTGLAEYLNGDIVFKDIHDNILIEDNYRKFSTDASSDGETSSEMASRSQLDVLKIELPGTNKDVWAIGYLTRDVSGFTALTTQIRNSSMVSIAIGIVVAWVVGWVLLHFTLFGKIKSFSNKLTEISKGHTEIDLPKVGKDEFLDMVNALARLRKSVEDSFQLRNMIEDSPIPTALIGLNGGIYFVNHVGNEQAIVKFEETSENKAKIWDVVGINEENLPTLSSTEDLPITEILPLGDKQLEIVVAAVRNAEGEHVRNMLTWEDVTAREKMANEVDEQRRNAEQRADEIGAQKKADEEEAKRIEELIAAFDTSIASKMSAVEVASGQVKTNAGAMAQMIEDTLMKSQSMDEASRETASNVQIVVEGADTLSNSVAQIRDQVEHTSTISQKAVGHAASTSQTMHGLADTAKRIGQVIELIEDIASQTNLLALNATIEAARAGDAGKGFAVVASEVKNLASQTEKATEEITSQISAIQEATSNSVVMTEEIAKTIEQIDEATSSIANAVETQASVIGNISSNAQSAAQSTLRVTDTVSEIADDASKTGGAADNQQNAANSMVEDFHDMQDQIKEFLTGIQRK